jgi:hypothetical protein
MFGLNCLFFGQWTNLFYYYFLNKKLTTVTMMKENYANPFRLIWFYKGVYLALNFIIYDLNKVDCMPFPVPNSSYRDGFQFKFLGVLFLGRQ